MKYNLYLTLRGPGGITEAPNTNNPIEADDLHEAIHRIADNVPTGTKNWIEVVGVRLILTELDRTTD